MKHKIKLISLAYIISSNMLLGQTNDSLVIRKIFSEALSNGKSYELLDHLCNNIGGRLSGSPQAAKAVEWSKQVMEDFGFDRVFLQEVMVPHWVRGEKEYAEIIKSKGSESIAVPVCALGGSVGTGSKGITANVVEVHNFEELEKLGGKKLKGKIVFYNRPMDPTHITTFRAYSEAVDQRWAGAMEAAKYGAIGVVVRSMTLALDDHPHTGSMGYGNDSNGYYEDEISVEKDINKIPAAAISTKGAELLSSLLKKDPGLQFHFKMSCQTLPDVKSYNVVGEIKGSKFTEEIILVGGHLDSWDLGDGAHDDGAGCVQAIEVLRIFKALNIRPKRTIRAVLFMNEENGLRGGKKYAELAKTNKEKHIAAIESDGGGSSPRGFGVSGKTEQVDKIISWTKWFEPYGHYQITKGGGGADISPLKDQNVTLIGLRVDSQRYFDYHHAVTDTFDKVNKRELELGAAAMAALVYLLDEYGL
ncbi:MAG: M20/M25/M40 family metallo-hydrolase [Cytophagales bacterium]|nr:M20/M25/M40 family metallo-hydrolase [Cytophagales bacterium]